MSGVPGPGDWTLADLPAPGAPSPSTPISMLPPASALQGGEWVPMVQGGITVKSPIGYLVNYIQLPTPVSVPNGGTGASFFPQNSLLVGGPTQFGAVLPNPGGAVLVGGAPPHWSTTGAAQTFLQGQGVGNDPIWTPIAGIPGPQGPAGTPGVSGPPGATGPQGLQGLQGSQGPQGSTGPPGQATTIVGFFSFKAPSQLPTTGLIPANWDSAGNPPAPVQLTVGQALMYTVNSHVWGYVGTGYTAAGWVDLGQTLGIQGPAGAQGGQGPQGPAGSRGPTGFQGSTGVQGNPGPTGPQGPQGVPGPQGGVGTQGVAGPQGQQGTAGLQGQQGAQGAPAQSVIVVGSFTVQTPASLPPSGFLPINWDSVGNPPTNVQMLLGEGLVHTTDSSIWLYVGTSVAAAGWANVGNSQGPPGPQGAQGNPGVQGPAGSTGPAGVAGPPGPGGATGSTGPAGPAGATGATGAAGPAGPTVISTDAGNQARLGSDSFVYVPVPATISPTAPSGPIPGVFWWDSIGAQLYLFYNDGDSTQWVPVVNQTGGYLSLGGGIVSGPVDLKAQAVTAAASTAINRALGENVDLTLGVTVTAMTISGWPPAGTTGKVRLAITNTGAFNISGWPTGTIWPGGVAPTITSGAGKRDLVLLMSDDGGVTIFGSTVGQDYH